MHLNFFFSLSTLFCYNFIREILSDKFDAIFHYRQLVVDTNDNNNEFTDFCLNTDPKTLAYICDGALEQLRKNHPYNDVYVFYPEFISEESKCVKGSVMLDETSSEIQYMKDCPAGPAVIPQGIEEKTFQIYNKIMVFAKSDNIFIFKKENELTNYNASISDWFIEPDYSFNVESKPSSISAKNRKIPATLYAKLPPSSLRHSSEHGNFKEKNLIPSKKLNRKNIVNKSNARTFAKLCMMALRRAKYNDVIVNVIPHVNEKPKAIDVKVKIGLESVRTTARPCYTYQMVAHFTNNELNEIFSPEEVKNLTSMKDKVGELGYELSPIDIREALNLDFDMLREKMDKIEYMLTVTSNPITYFLTQVPDENSILIIKKPTADESSMEYECLEAITNISEEYLERIDLDNEVKYLSRLRTLQVQESRLLLLRKHDVWSPTDSTANNKKVEVYDSLLEQLHKEKDKTKIMNLLYGQI